MTNIKTTIWKSFIFLIIFIVSIFILVVPYMKLIDNQLSKSVSRLFIDFISIVPVIFASWIMTKYIDKNNFSKVDLKDKNLFKDLTIGTLLGLFWIVISFFGQCIFGTILKNTESQLLDGNFIFYTVALFLNAAAQELLCRGYLFQIIKINVGLKTSIITTSIIFLLMHGGAISSGIVPSLNIFGAGIVFAIARYKTGQLWLPIMIHFVWNFIYSSILYKPIEGYKGLEIFHTKGSLLLAGGQNGVEATIITTVTIVIIIFVEIILLKKRKEN